MNDKLLVETAVLAGEIMLISGAEIYRVEDTINRILKKSNRSSTEAIVLPTGIFATINDPDKELITITRRVTDRSTNLNRVYLVNDISRKLCGDIIGVEEAYRCLKEAETRIQFHPRMKRIAMVTAAIFFALLLGGGVMELLAAAFVGGVLALTSSIACKIQLNDFCANAVSAFLIAFTAFGLKQWGEFPINSDLVIISAIMPLVPGVIFTTAIRDTLNGDYASGAARIMEAVVIALAVASGVGAGIACFGWLSGGMGI